MIKKLLLIGGICVALALGAMVWLFVAFYMDMERGEKHQRQLRADQTVSPLKTVIYTPILYMCILGLVTVVRDL